MKTNKYVIGIVTAIAIVTTILLTPSCNITPEQKAHIAGAVVVEAYELSKEQGNEKLTAVFEMSYHALNAFLDTSPERTSQAEFIAFTNTYAKDKGMSPALIALMNSAIKTTWQQLSIKLGSNNSIEILRAFKEGVDWAIAINRPG